MWCILPIDYFKHFIENFNKVYRNGKYVEAQPIAEKYVTIMRRNQSVKNGMLKKFFEGYLTTFADPMTVARYMDKYENGFYSEMLSTLREGATNAQIDEMIIRQPIEDFIKRNKKYFVEAQKKTVNYNGQNIPLLQAMYLYMAISDSDTIPSLAKSGFVYNDGEREVRVNGFAQNEDIEVGEMQAMAKEIQSSLEKQFSTTDKEYIEIARKIFNEECRKRYTDTSIILKGYSNAKEGDYVPIRRANVAKNVDTSTLEYEINRASNASFTKDRVKGATSELRVEEIAQPYNTPEMFAIKMQMDVKVVPKECKTGEFKDEKDFQYTMIDEATRERFIYPYKEQSTYSTIDFLKRAFVYFGYLPAIVQTDNGTEFTTPKIAKETTVCVVDKFLMKYGIKHKLIKPRTPRHNGKVERSHRTDQECFYNYLQYSTYEELKDKMAEWLNRYNNRPHSALRNREGKRVWLTPLQKREELLEDYRKSGFKYENENEIKIRFLKKSA